MIGQRIGHYVIEEKLGEGGMGVVYRARDEKLRRDVALKFLGTLPTGSSAMHERVLEEARAISALNHPNICTVYEVGECDGQPYIAMEFVEGKPLSLEIPSTGLSQAQVERFGMQLSDALAHAHSRGVIHRDLKAANVMVTPTGRLKVLDFGISRRIEENAGDGTTRFDKTWGSQHTFTGTLPYIAPEVLKGTAADVRSDIWALGVLLYEMAAGRRPFRGGTAYELSASILREDPPSIAPALPPVLQSIIDRCLDKDQGQRYQSAGEVRAALEAAGTASRSQEFVTTPTHPQEVPKRPLWAGLLALVAVVALAIGAGYWWKSRSTTKPRTVLPGAIQSLAVLPLDNISGDASQDYFADGMTDALITELSQIRKLRVISRTSVMSYKHTQKTLPEIAQELNVDAIVEGTVLRAGNRVRVSAKLIQTNVDGALWAENFERNFTDVLKLQSDVATAIAHGIQVELSTSEQSQLARTRTVVPEAYDAYLRGRYDAAKRTGEGANAAVEEYKKAIELDPSFASAYAALADAYMYLSNYDLRAPAEMVPLARHAAEKALSLDDHLGEAHISLAMLRFYHLDQGDKENEFLKGIALNPSYADGLHWYALYLASKGRKDESLTEIKLAQEIDPKSLIIAANVGWCYYLGGDYAKAIEAQKQALKLDPSFGIAYGYLGQAYLENGQNDEAIDALRKYVSLAPGELARKAELAGAYGRAGRKAEWQEIHDQFAAQSGKRYISSYDWAMIYAGIRDKKQTLDALQKAVNERNGRLVNLAVHPHFAFLRGEPEFQQMVKKLESGFPE